MLFMANMAAVYLSGQKEQTQDAKKNKMKLTNGNKVATIATRADGFSATVVQNYNNGLEMTERFIALKFFSNQKRAITWAQKQMA